MKYRTAVWSALVVLLFASGCGKSAPTAPDAPTTTAPAILLAGESNAYFLQPFLSNTIGVVTFPASIDYWLTGPEFAAALRTPQLAVFVWAQGAGDFGISADDYAQKLRRLIQMVRSSHNGLPVRIVEIPDTPTRAAVRQAQREVSSDAGVELIPTADLPFDDSTGHLTAAGYQTIRDRIYRSIGR